MKHEDLLLISIGGAAAGIACRIAERTPSPMRVLILDTDDETLQNCLPAEGVSVSIFGTKRLGGRGTGGDYRLGAGALRDDYSMIQQQIGTPRLAIVLICGGGGTSGAGQLLLSLLRDQGIATMTVATAPFAFEGDDRKRCAAVVLPTLESSSDAISRVPLDRLLSSDLRTLPIQEAFDAAADRLAAAVSLLWTLLCKPAFFAFEAGRFHQFITFGAAAAGLPFTFADATAAGADRAEQVLESLKASPLFQVDGIDRLANAATIVVGVLAGDDLRLCELSTVMDGLRAHCASLKDAFLGTAVDPVYADALTVVVLAFSSPALDVTAKNDTLQSPAIGKRPRSARPRAASRLGTVNSRFTDMEQTIMNGQNLDEPTYQRRGIRLAR